MDYAVIFFGLLSIGCTCMIFLIISTYNRKISDVQKATSKVHFKMLEVESNVNSLAKKEKDFGKRASNFSKGKEIIYRIPKKISGNLTMEQNGHQASVKASLKVESVDD